MKEQLIAIIVDKTGIDAAKAGQAVDAVLGFLKENPEKLSALLADDRLDDVTEKLGKLFGR